MSYASAYEQYMLELINAERADVSAQPLAFNTYLNNSSEDHSAWMLEKDIFSHTGITGSNPGERMQAAGYQFTGYLGLGREHCLQQPGKSGGLCG